MGAQVPLIEVDEYGVYAFATVTDGIISKTIEIINAAILNDKPFIIFFSHLDHGAMKFSNIVDVDHTLLSKPLVSK